MAVNVLLPLLIPLGEQITNGSGSLYFTKSGYDVEVKENLAPVDLVTLQAKSNTTVGEVRYKIMGGASSEKFLANSRSGLITLNSPLDYEIQDTHELIVGAEIGQEKTFSRLVVHVQDVNDLPPEFERPLYETQMTEEDDRHLPKSILQVTAYDGDLRDRASLRYYLSGDGVATTSMPSFESSNPKSTLLPPLVLSDNVTQVTSAMPYFAINSSNGDILLLQPLDRDAPNGRAKWVLKVHASDSLHSAETTLHVNVKDINDNAPFFTKEVILGTVQENAPEGSEVVQVEAIDLDDPNEGAHAKVYYSLEKNVIDEESGSPIFTIDQETGKIRTALCCLDREKTASYALQVVATDGGGLKGTGSVNVMIEDENDVFPRFALREWDISVRESASPNTSLGIVSLVDPDIKNNFSFKIVPNTGFGWDRFVVVPSHPDKGVLMAVLPLDYEDDQQRKGFNFSIEVTDKASSDGKNRTDTLLTRITLIDDNDNYPKLQRSWVNLTLREDTTPGRVLAKFSATDRDNAGTGKIFYTIDKETGRNGLFRVDSEGVVRLQHPLDREKTSRHYVRVLAIDAGVPPHTATATMSLTVTDVNDNPPFIKSPSSFTIAENAEPSFIANIYMDDLDDWTLGNGPPFKISLDKNAPEEIKGQFSLEYKPAGDGGHGMGVLSSLRSMDREKGHYRALPIQLTDGKGQTSTVTLTVTLIDVNDNSMKPGNKTITVVRIKGRQGEIPLGRVFIDDPDDCDAGDKKWEWLSEVSPAHFILDPTSGKLFAHPEIQDDEYHLRFLVSDVTHGQFHVPANVTVRITTLNVGPIITPAIPISISSHRPRELIASKAGEKTALDQFLDAINAVLDHRVQVISLEESRSAILFQNYQPISTTDNGQNTIGENDQENEKLHEEIEPIRQYDGSLADNIEFLTRDSATKKDTSQNREEESTTPPSSPPFHTRLWITSNSGRLIDQRLLINRIQISKLSGVAIQDVGVGICAHLHTASRHLHHPGLRHRLPQTRENTTPAYWVIDANTTALITPKLTIEVGCNCKVDGKANLGRHNPAVNSQPLQLQQSTTGVPSCHPNPCSNGGRCISSSEGPKCICPENTDQPTCKQLSREVLDQGWAWVDPIPTCSYSHISLEFFTEVENCVLLYSGPGSDSQERSRGDQRLLQGDILSIELHRGLPRLVLDMEGMTTVITPEEAGHDNDYQKSYYYYKSRTKQLGNYLDSKTGLADGDWHRIDVIFTDKDVELVIDLCQNDLDTCSIKAPLPLIEGRRNNTSPSPKIMPRTPLQLGGLAHSSFSGSPKSLLSYSSLGGCIRNLRINGRLYDLGENLLSSNSKPGCKKGDFCKSKGLKCSRKSKCTGSRWSPTCECLPGWKGDNCQENTFPATFERESYVKFALSFAPSQTSTYIQLRFRTWASRGQLILVSSQHSRDQLSVSLEEGKLCLLLALRLFATKSWVSKKQIARPFTLCLAKVALNDGRWHTVYAKRFGKYCELAVDSGEWPLYNSSALVRDQNVPRVLPLVPHDVTSKVNAETKWGSEPLIIDRQEGVHIGGVPEYVGASQITVRHDFVQGCIDDVRLDGHLLPLPPRENSSRLAQATTFGSGVTSSCVGGPTCANVTCPDPLICLNLWRRHHCGCGEGKVLTSVSSSCVDINECVWQPCLNGGTCINTDPGYHCDCPMGYLGSNCEFEGVQESNQILSISVLIGAISWLILLIIFMGSLAIHHKCRKKRQSKSSQDTNSVPAGASCINRNNPPTVDMGITYESLVQLKLLDRPDLDIEGTQWLAKKQNVPEVDVLRVGRTHSNTSSTTNPIGSSGGPEVDNWIGLGNEGPKPPGIRKEVGCGDCRSILGPCDDLRYYAYEGEGNSPGSLSSCCSGSNSSSKNGDRVVEASIGRFNVEKNLQELKNGSLQTHHANSQQSV